ncbi:MAG: SMP-30/gluconolactonase/LRE family protein [Tepidisphaeraceae bacterium]|jgi:gluconolactonase
MRYFAAVTITFLFLCGCKTVSVSKQQFPAIGSIERLSPELGDIIADDARVELLADRFKWVEGPVWVPRGEFLLFSDIPANMVYRWKEGKGVSAYLKPAGYSGPTPRGGELGANGLALDANGRLILCQHGDRRIAKLEKSGVVSALAERYDDRRFNSPNDLAINRRGDIYFTDPIHGLAGGATDPGRELPYCGVYRLARNGQVTLLTRQLTLPNGIALSPDEKWLYVSVSDPARPVIMKYEVKSDGTLGEDNIFFDATSLTGSRKGLPDGLKVDEKGNVFATGPGGVLIISPDGRHLGTILTGEPTSNCAWGGDGGTLYITANHMICRIRTLTRGAISGL